MGTRILTAVAGGVDGPRAEVQSYRTDAASVVTMELTIVDRDKCDAVLKKLEEAERRGEPTGLRVWDDFVATEPGEMPRTSDTAYAGYPRDVRRTPDGLTVSFYTMTAAREEKMGVISPGEDSTRK